MDNLLDETKYIMKKYHIKANKSLGQNFLINQNVINSMIEKSDIQKEDLVIEIGPGLGTLTKYLLEKAGKVICIELDSKMEHIIKERFYLYKNLELIHQDILKIDLQSIIKKEKEENGFTNVKVVANLPYYITTPIIMKLLEDGLDLEGITVMVQKEVADRLIAIPGQKQTGAITYAIYYYATAEEIIEVEKDSFIPEPKVTSKIIKLTLRKAPPISVGNKQVMFRIIKSAFMQRRKTLLNALTNAKVFLNKEEGIEILKKLNLEETVRAENLTLQNFADITNIILKKSI